MNPIVANRTLLDGPFEGFPPASPAHCMKLKLYVEVCKQHYKLKYANKAGEKGIDFKVFKLNGLAEYKLDVSRLTTQSPRGTSKSMTILGVITDAMGMFLS